ncbi:MAG: hypothetical protein K6C34_02190 [Alphaproteobacteria bacterium]|nr:hypothetical protein [Alphaproteobacteria bacterium]
METLTETIDSDDITLRRFTKPSETIDFVNDVSATNHLDFLDITAFGEENTSDWQSIMVSVNRLHREIHNPERLKKHPYDERSYASN